MPKRKYTKEFLAPLVAESVSYSDLLRKLELRVTGGSQRNIKRRIDEYGISIEHFVNTNGGQKSWNRKKPCDILVRKNSKIRTDSKQLRRALLEVGVSHTCIKCGNDGTWMGEKITLEIDHIDGDWTNNLQTNLRFLCPNCHSQTPNYYNQGASSNG